VSGQGYKILSASHEALTMSAALDTTIAGLSSYTGSSDQLWVFWPTGLGPYWVVNVGTGMALDDHGGGGVGVQIQQWTWNSGNNHQYWTLTPE
jgi:Ricin-type beta-trefoil lectin domain-like